MGAITSIPLCSRAKEDAAEKPGLPKAPSSPASTVVNQPVPANVSLEIAEKLNQAKEEQVEEQEVEDLSEEVGEAVSDGEAVDLDRDSNQSIHLSGENIALDDDCDEEPDEEEEEGEGEDVRQEQHSVLAGGKGESDTAAKITNLLSELASQCESQEVIQSR